MTEPNVARAAAHQREHAEEYLSDLEALVRIPSVSFPGFPAEEVKRSAEAIDPELAAVDKARDTALKQATKVATEKWAFLPSRG